MRLRLIHDAEGRILSHAPPGTELAGPLDADQRISEVEAPDIDHNEVDIARVQAEYRVQPGSDPPALVPLQEGTPRSGAGRPTQRSSTFPPRLPQT